MPDDDDKARRAAAGRTERLSSPLVPGVPGVRLPPAGPKLPAVPPRLVPQEPELEPTRNDLPQHPQRVRQRTLVGPAAPPARGAAPEPPSSIPSLLPPVEVETEPPGSMGPTSSGRDFVANPYDRPTLVRRSREELARHGDRLHAASVSSPAPASSTPLPAPAGVPKLEPSLVAKAAKFPLPRLLVLIITAGGVVTGIVTAIGVQTVSVINAMKPPNVAEIQERLHALEEAKKGDSGLALEAAARQAKEKELGDAVTAASTKAAACDGVAQRLQKVEDRLKIK